MDMSEETLHQKNLPLGSLCTEAGIDCPAQAVDIPIVGVTADSRRVKPGWLFIAIRGMHCDAMAYAADAVTAGAAAVVTDSSAKNELPDTIPMIVVPDARMAMAYLFDAWYGHPARKLCLVGVTGTNGKTSVSTMLWHILRHAEIPTGLIGTVGNTSPGGEYVTIRSDDECANMTTPDPEELYAILACMAAGAPEGQTVTVVMEVTSHALLLGKLAPLHFDLGLFTNLTPEHQDFHESMDDYYEAKRMLFEQTTVAVVNADDMYGRRLLDESVPVEKWMVCRATGRDRQEEKLCRNGDCCRVYAEQIRLRGADGVEYRLTTPCARVRVKCSVPGEFTVENTMLAAVSALELGVDPVTVRKALETFPGVPGRMERVSPGRDCPFSIFIDYAHTPDALENLLGTARRFAGRGERVVLVFGCGGDRDKRKRPLMADVASRLADRIIITSDNCRGENPGAIINDILQGMDKDADYVVVPDRAAAIRCALETAHVGDIILLAGKGHEAYEIDACGKHPFSEREIVLDTWYKMKGKK